MPKVIVEKRVRPVEHDVSIRVEFIDGGGAVASTARWTSSDIIPALQQLFGKRPGERIAALVINEHGITAEFVHG